MVVVVVSKEGGKGGGGGGGGCTELEIISIEIWKVQGFVWDP